MRRQFGADHVQLDTREQWAKAHLFKPQTLDFEKFLNAAESANFPTTELSIELVLRKDGDAAVVVETGQRFRLAPNTLQPGEERRVQVRVEGFDTDDPLFSRYEMPEFDEESEAGNNGEE